MHIAILKWSWNLGPIDELISERGHSSLETTHRFKIKGKYITERLRLGCSPKYQ